MSKKPYDAHQTLKPGEPHFTLQGGDPLAPKAISYYADLIRKDALKRDTKREVSAGLHRAASCDEIAWSFDDYRRAGIEAEDEAKPKRKVDLAAGARNAAERRGTLIDCAKLLSNARSTIEEAAEALLAISRTEFAEDITRLRDCQNHLLESQEAIDPRENGSAT